MAYKAFSELITQKQIKFLFKYCHGNFLWLRKSSPMSNRKIGSVAGSKNKNGYIQIGLYGKTYYLHRLIFLYHYGFLPEVIDHVDGNPLNNKIENLRECTTKENMYNARTPSTNTSGTKGIHWQEKREKWYAQIRFDGKLIYIGRYDLIEDAKKAIESAREIYHKEFFNHGRLSI